MYELSNVSNFYKIQYTASVDGSSPSDFEDSTESIHLNFFFFLQKKIFLKKKRIGLTPFVSQARAPKG